ncbi:MAG: AMP-binding protein [Spirochaetota bacterium]
MTHPSVPITPLDAWIKKKIASPEDNLSRESISDYQLKKIQETIGQASRNSRFYHDRLQGFAEKKLSSLNDLTRLPFTTQEDIQANALQMLCVSQGEINRVVTLDTSGTTGNPKRLYFTSEDQELTIDFFKTGMSTLTEAGDRVLILLPCERPGSVGDLLAIALELLGAVPIRHGIVKNIPETIQKFADTVANVAVGIPIQMLALARFYKSGVNKPPIKLKKILLSTDYLSQAIAEILQNIFKCETFDHYGMTEMGLGGGVECCAHIGYHLREADLFFEIVDPQTGEPLPEGSYGEIVFTTLTRHGMPLIRYRTGDLSRFIPGRCQCGTILHRLENIKARSNSPVLIDNDYYLSIADLDERLLPLDGVIDYNASAVRKKESVILKLKITTLRIKPSDHEIHNALDKIPGVRQAKSLGKLEIAVESETCNADYIPATGKRRFRQS